MFINLSILLFVPVFVYAENALEDLETRTQDFVLYSQKIEIEGYPDAFNPSIIRWHDQLLLSFRYRYGENRSTDGIGLTWLDEKFQPIGTPFILKRPSSLHISQAQDPHLVNINNNLYIVYSNVEKTPSGWRRRVFIGEIYYDGVCFYMPNTECISYFPGKIDNRIEKNWVPFDYKGHFMLSYSIQPHCVFYPVFGKKKCELFSLTTATDLQWNWGEIRGGTSALLLNDKQYMAFFHSSMEMKTIHSQGKKHSHYFIGAYTFSAFPPFELNQISPEPIIGMNFYKGLSYKTWKPLWCVFPGGYVQDEHFVWIAYGRQDHEVWIVKLDKQKLLDSLVPVSSYSLHPSVNQ